MKIAILTELFLPHIGGQEVRYAELAEALLAEGHQVDVYCVRHDHGVPSQEIHEGVRVLRHPLSPKYTQPVFKATRRRVLPLLRYSLWCRKRLRRERYDLCIFNQWPLAHALIAPSWARTNGVLDWCEVRHNWLFRQIQSKLPKLASRNMAVSTAVAEHIESVSQRPVEFVPSGIVRSRYYGLPRAERQTILYVGRVMEHKNLELLIHAFSLAADGGLTGNLVIAGDGPDLPRIRRIASETNVSHRIKFEGFVSEEEKLRLLATSAILAIPSRREGFPRVVAEAMASGLPIVTADFPENGTRHVVEQYRAGLVTHSDTHSFGKGLLEVLDRWEEFSQTGRAASVDMDWKALVGKVLGKGPELQHQPERDRQAELTYVS